MQAIATEFAESLQLRAPGSVKQDTMHATLTTGPAPCASPGPLPRGATARSLPSVWEYKVAIAAGDADCASARVQDELLEPLRRNGWIIIGGDAGIFYLKRPKWRGLRT